jgi:hypothetical protein
MYAMKDPQSNDRLGAAMADWQISPSRDPQFRARVWSRIEAAPRSASWPRYVQAHRAAVAGGIAIAVAVGAMSGRVQAKARAESDRSTLATNYVQALDARTMKMP